MSSKELNSGLLPKAFVLTDLILKPSMGLHGVGHFFRKIMNSLNHSLGKSLAIAKNLSNDRGYEHPSYFLANINQSSSKQNTQEPTPDDNEAYGQPQIAKNILKALEDLPKEQYDIFLDYTSGLKYWEIAATYHMSTAKVKSQILLIRKGLEEKCLLD
ncbi:RNA polymerase sigma factor [Sphingobacterium hungaricum]|uniref:Uncharacterized protein n=1 Tax=Sphingobacterium hungaricum TaxID=2082723 RepID=A0A928UXP9_9SPHI|nr:sigma-70 family RNA polymerase sigma factor [Sphingobacterium hungaricum]MBE8715150.1 hypothetical protein [Sphingobacterium hungaricum]